MNYNARVTRLRRIATHDRIFFVTTNIARGRPDLRLAERNVILAVLSEERARGSFWLFGYVVMPDHAHLLLAPRHCDLDEAMRRIKSVASKRIQEQRHAAGTLWQPCYFDRIVRHTRDFWQKLAYIHRNPVEGSVGCKSARLALVECCGLRRSAHELSAGARRSRELARGKQRITLAGPLAFPARLVARLCSPGRFHGPGDFLEAVHAALARVTCGR